MAFGISGKTRGLVSSADTTAYGFCHENEDIPMKVRGGAVVIGDLVMLDALKADAGTTTATPFAVTAIYANVIPVSAGAMAGTAPGIFFIALEAADDDGTALFRMSGVVDAMVIGASGSLAIGTRMNATTANNLDIVATTGRPVLAIGAGALTTPTSRALGSVWFSGFVRCFGVQP